MKPKIERRIVDAKIEVRTNEDGTVGVRGYAAVFDSPSHGEVVKRSAFTRTLAQRDNVRLLINHEGTPLASTRSGTMTLGTDDHGLWFDAPDLDMSNPKVQEFVSATGRGDMHQCSFAFYSRDCPTIDGVREIREAELVDVSGVTYPWYEDTEMSLTGDREADRGLLACRNGDRSPALTSEQTAFALRALRAAPPGKYSYEDLENAIWSALDEMLAIEGSWSYIYDFGADWLVYRAINPETYEYGPCLQRSWKQNADASFKFGEPFEVERVTEYRPVGDPEPVIVKSYTISEARTLLGLAS